MYLWTVNGKCPCGGTYEDREVQVRLTSSSTGAVTVLESVPQAVCPICESRAYHASILQRIEAAFQLAEDSPRADSDPSSA